MAAKISFARLMHFCILRRNSRWHPPKWRQSDFCEMSQVHSADTLQIKNFIKIALSRTVSKTMFCMNTEIQDGRQKWRESDFCEKLPVDSADNLQIRNLSKSLYLEQFPK